MKFNVPNGMDDEPSRRHAMAVGNVYKCHGGGKTRFWVVMGFDDRSVSMLGINAEGKVTSATTYGRHVFEGFHYGDNLFKQRRLVGRVNGLEQLTFDLQPLEIT